jgi:soluble cytochrome b562
MNEADNIWDKALLASVTISIPGNSRRVDVESVLSDKTTFDHDWVTSSKRLLDAKEFDDIRTIVGRLKRMLERRCIVAKGGPGADKPALRRFLKSGVYVLPLGLVAEVDAEIQAYRDEFNAAVEKFLDVYPRLRDEAKAKLGDLFDVADYPPVEALKRSFAIDVSYLNVSTPKALESVSREIFQREQEQAKKQWAEASAEIRQVLRTGFEGVVSWMVDALKPAQEGERQKQFRGASIQRLLEFLNDFEAKNLTQDSDLADLVAKTKALLDGEDIESIQKASKSDDWRTDMAEKFGEIKESLEPLLSEPAERLITLE